MLQLKHKTWESPSVQPGQNQERRQQFSSNIRPVRQQRGDKDSLLLAGTMESRQENVSLALACDQAQELSEQWVIQILREGRPGNLPLEMENVTEGERQLMAWWKLVN